MAIYEYYCPTCKADFERRLPMSDVDTAVKCDCGSEADRKLSLFAVAGQDRDMDFDFDPGAMGGGCACGGACACSA